MSFLASGGRPSARSTGGMVTAPHGLAAQSGLFILKNGGNAADAIIATAAVLAVVYPHMTGIGGDVFFIYYDGKRGEVHAYNGSGAAAQAATLQRYRGLGLHAIPERGGAAVVTVPGTIDAWFALHERFGSLDMERILAPAIAYALHGAPAARSFVAAVNRLREVLAVDEGASSLYVDHGPAQIGAQFKNARLGAALAAIAKGGRQWFYEGEGAGHVDRCCRRVDSPLRAEDLAAHHGFFTTPVAARFYGLDSITTQPNSQGVAALVAQQTYERYAAQNAGMRLDDLSAARTHAGVESIRLAFAARDECVGDPREGASWEPLLSAARAETEAARIDPNAALPQAPSSAGQGDTAYFACVDRDGNAVSFIQSLFHSFGAGVVVPELGFPLQNRGMAFELSQDKIRSLAPGKLPFHTLMPCMLMRQGKPWLVYGSMGGEGQPQTALQIATRVAHDGCDPQSAIEAPRWRWGKDLGDERSRVHVELRIGAACISGLRARGHDVNVLADWDESMGHAGAIVVDASGVFTGGADPRGDGAALGF
ncbi:MAG: gamma-glutamyltransferase family protein [Candidatus Eremiobacteraeota bacterium]|nr:gamma-glutamyltransferase family protein [Candidatus Eremiobacteraeota bacterium]